MLLTPNLWTVVNIKKMLSCMKVNKNLNYGRLYWPQTDKYTKSVKSTKQKYTVISQNRMKV